MLKHLTLAALMSAAFMPQAMAQSSTFPPTGQVFVQGTERPADRDDRDDDRDDRDDRDDDRGGEAANEREGRGGERGERGGKDRRDHRDMRSGPDGERGERRGPPRHGPMPHGPRAANESGFRIDLGQGRRIEMRCGETAVAECLSAARPLLDAVLNERD